MQEVKGGALTQKPQWQLYQLTVKWAKVAVKLITNSFSDFNFAVSFSCDDSRIQQTVGSSSNQAGRGTEREQKGARMSGSRGQGLS